MRYMVYLAIALYSCLGYSQNVRTYIPEQAVKYLPIVKEESERLMSDLSMPWYFPGLIEHESCISLKHSKCWNPNSRLQTKRELGLGLGQITKTYNSDGSIRFDALSDLRKAYMSELRDMSWSNISSRPDLQIRSIILMTRNNYKQLFVVKDIYNRLAMSDSAYNGGLGSVKKRRQICGLKHDCDPDIWFDNLEHIVVKSTKPLYAGRSAQDINNHHVYDVLKIRMPKYTPYFESNP